MLPGGAIHAKVVVRDSALDIVSGADGVTDEQVRAALGGRLDEVNQRLRAARHARHR
jgi:hypothetical protein